MLTHYIDNCVHILFILFVADASLRFYKLLREYIIYKKYYSKNEFQWQIFKRCYSYNNYTLWLFIICLLYSLSRAITISKSSNTRSLFSLAPPLFWLSFVPLYWIIYLVGFEKSNLDYAEFLRENHGLDYGEGMASNYFHGYLKLTLPSYTEHPGIRERIEEYSARHGVRFAVDRLIILIPDTMYVKPVIESRFLEKVAPLETVVKNRAGVQRPFRNDVYRFTYPINGIYYYIVLEGATPLVSFFDSLNFQLSATWQMMEMQREILLKFYTHLSKLLKWPETDKEVELVFYNTIENDRIIDVGQYLLGYMQNKLMDETVYNNKDYRL